MIERISEVLSRRGQLPTHCDLSRIGPCYLSALHFDLDPEALIREEVFSGMDSDQDTAILKSLIEYVERLAILENSKAGVEDCLTHRSDGFAAFPKFRIGELEAKRRARENALSEAIERFAWATWWDQPTIGCHVDDNLSLCLSKQALELLNAICKIVKVKTCVRVRPIIDFDYFEVEIFFLVLENGGLTSGGACGVIGSPNTSVRALGELARHTEAARRLMTGVSAKTFYERRLKYMALNPTSDKLLNRLHKGQAKVHLPPLKTDKEIHHSLESLVVVHRCLFENQPDFVGGALERLCL